MKQKKLALKKTKYAIFNSSINERLLFNQKQVKDALTQQNCFSISNSTYEANNWKYIFQNMIECLAPQIFIRGNCLQNIPQQLKVPLFSNLKLILLINNQISNIERICELNCQNLEFISLTQNNISNLSCLKKWKHSSLRNIAIDINPIRSDLSVFCTTNLNADKIQYFYVQRSDHPVYNIIGHDIGKLVKIQSKRMNTLKIQSAFRIIQTKVDAMLMKRFYDQE